MAACRRHRPGPPRTAPALCSAPCSRGLWGGATGTQARDHPTLCLARDDNRTGGSSCSLDSCLEHDGHAEGGQDRDWLDHGLRKRPGDPEVGRSEGGWEADGEVTPAAGTGAGRPRAGRRDSVGAGDDRAEAEGAA